CQPEHATRGAPLSVPARVANPPRGAWHASWPGRGSGRTARGEADVSNTPPVQRLLLQWEGDPPCHRLIGFQDHSQVVEALGAGHLRLLSRPDAVPKRLDHRDQPTGVVGILPGPFGAALLQSEPGCPHLESDTATCPRDRDPRRGGTLRTGPRMVDHAHDPAG